MLGLLYHRATLLALILIVTFSARIFTNAIQRILKIMKNMNNKELADVLIGYGIVAALFLLAAHLEYLFNLSI